MVEPAPLLFGNGIPWAVAGLPPGPLALVGWNVMLFSVVVQLDVTELLLAWPGAPEPLVFAEWFD